MNKTFESLKNYIIEADTSTSDLLDLYIKKSAELDKVSQLTEDLSKKFKAAVLEGDMTTTLDAARLKKLNIPVVPITTGRACHLESLINYVKNN